MHKNAIFPELRSKNVKKSFNNLFASHQYSDFSPAKRYEPNQQSNK
jgi:hypothetical protein